MDQVFSGSDGHPERISRFEILEILGEGAMGVVYRARDPVLEREVALKIIRPELAGESKNRARFLRECRAAATINHPGVATIYEAGETEDGLLFLASELVDGETLNVIVERGPLPPAEVVDLGIQLADALDAAHSKGAVHRDIKPSNLMLGAGRRLKVLDFGLARLVSSDDSSADDDRRTAEMTQEGAVVGTPAYMSPEQASGMKVDARTDLFSAGCVLYELVTGKSPFRSDSVPETLRRVLVEEPPSITSSGAAMPAGLEETLRSAMAKDRDGRTATAAEMADAFRSLRGGSSTGTMAAMRPMVPRRRRGLVIGGIAGVLAIVVAVLLVWQWSRPSLAFANNDRLLVADVENLTGDETFDLALHTALVADLKQSPFAAVYGPQQVQRTLRLMRQPADSFVDEKLGRDICRFSALRAMVVPRIELTGDVYELRADIVDPQTGRHVEKIQVHAEDREEVLLEAIDELTREVRKRLGETLESIDDADFPISDVTTSSWEAMHYFAMGQLEWGAGNFEEAVRMFQLAVDIDPLFATCRGTLGLLLVQFMGEEDRGKAELERALADGDTLPRDEYLMLRAANRQFVDGDLEGALGEYDLITGIYPSYMAAYNNKGRVLMALGRYEEAVENFEKAASLDRQGIIPLINLAFMSITSWPNAAAAEDACRRLVAIDDEVANYHSLMGWAVAVQGRYEEAREILERAVDLEPDHGYAVPNLGLVLLAEGKPESALLFLRRAAALAREAGNQWVERGTSIDLAVALAASGEDAQVRTMAEEAEATLAEDLDGAPMGFWDHAYLVQIFAAAGRVEDAEEHFVAVEAQLEDEAEHCYEYARCCAMLGRRRCAIEQTARALEMGLRDPFQPMLSSSMNSLLGDPEFMALFPVNGWRSVRES